MSSEQQFYIQIITLILAGVVTPMLALFGVVLNKRQDAKVESLDAKVVENHKQVNSRMDEYMKALEEKFLLQGQNQGRAQEKADQALRQETHLSPVAANPGSVPTAQNPLLTEVVMKEILADQPPPTVIADKGEGWEQPPK